MLSVSAGVWMKGKCRCTLGSLCEVCVCVYMYIRNCMICMYTYIHAHNANGCLLSLFVCVRCWLPLLQVSVSDYSGGTWLTLFQEHAEQVLGRRSEEMGQLKEQVRAAELPWGYRPM